MGYSSVQFVKMDIIFYKGIVFLYARMDIIDIKISVWSVIHLVLHVHKILQVVYNVIMVLI